MRGAGIALVEIQEAYLLRKNYFQCNVIEGQSAYGGGLYIHVGPIDKMFIKRENYVFTNNSALGGAYGPAWYTNQMPWEPSIIDLSTDANYDGTNFICSNKSKYNSISRPSIPVTSIVTLLHSLLASETVWSSGRLLLSSLEGSLAGSLAGGLLRGEIRPIHGQSTNMVAAVLEPGGN